MFLIPSHGALHHAATNNGNTPAGQRHISGVEGAGRPTTNPHSRIQLPMYITIIHKPGRFLHLPTPPPQPQPELGPSPSLCSLEAPDYGLPAPSGISHGGDRILSGGSIGPAPKPTGITFCPEVVVPSCLGPAA